MNFHWLPMVDGPTGAPSAGYTVKPLVVKPFIPHQVKVSGGTLLMLAPGRARWVGGSKVFGITAAELEEMKRG